MNSNATSTLAEKRRPSDQTSAEKRRPSDQDCSCVRGLGEDTKKRRVNGEE